VPPVRRLVNRVSRSRRQTSRGRSPGSGVPLQFGSHAQWVPVFVPQSSRPWWSHEFIAILISPVYEGCRHPLLSNRPEQVSVSRARAGLTRAERSKTFARNRRPVAALRHCRFEAQLGGTLALRCRNRLPAASCVLTSLGRIGPSSFTKFGETPGGRTTTGRAA
jgi:hypothetical protein